MNLALFDNRCEVRRTNAGRLVVAGQGREVAVVGRGHDTLFAGLRRGSDVSEELGLLPRTQPAVNQRVDVAGATALEAVAVGDKRAPQRRGQAGAADHEEAAAAGKRGAVAFRRRLRVTRAELGVAG